MNTCKIHTVHTYVQTRKKCEAATKQTMEIQGMTIVRLNFYCGDKQTTNDCTYKNQQRNKSKGDNTPVRNDVTIIKWVVEPLKL